MVSKRLLLRRLLVLVTATAALSVAGTSYAIIVVRADGRDEANLASEGNHGTFNANVNFAFQYGQVVAENLSPNPPGPSSSSFDYFSTATPDGGGIGFGTNQISFDASAARIELSLTVNEDNELPWLYVILKDTDLPVFAAEDQQYRIDIPAVPGDYVLYSCLEDGCQDFVFNEQDGIPNYDAGGLGLSELQIQYPFGQPEPRAHMDLTIHYLRIRIPEPGTGLLAGLGTVLLGVIGSRRRLFASDAA